MKQRKQHTITAPVYIAVCLVFSVCGWGIGYVTRDIVFIASDGSSLEHPGAVAAGSGSSSGSRGTSRQLKIETEKATKKWPGDSIHSVFTSSGDPYQNFQTRIMYATYKMVQKMPGGERLTGFTRILHRTVPDILMDEVPTFHSFPHKPQCDGWCDYPVANRPYAIKEFFDAVAKNESMIQGAWVFMLECDYVWMQPMKVPGSAYDLNTLGVQFHYDYIVPSHPNVAKEMRKLYPNGSVENIPPSGPAPVLLRAQDWIALAGDYLQASIKMEADQAMIKTLEWVREMYAWDVAVAMHADKVKIKLEHPPKATTIVQPPFDEDLGDAALCHYTWGALYHEGLPSKGGKQVYRWEKRDYNDPKHVIKVPHIPMPPEYKDGWTLEFDAPLNRKRHDLVVRMLTQMNKAIDTLPDLTERNKAFQVELKHYEKERDERLASIKRKEAVKAAALAATNQVTAGGKAAGARRLQ